MTMTVQGPGFTIDFPDGTDDATINKQMSIAHAQFKTAQRNPEASGDVSVGSVARSLFRGLPGIGTFRDELAAGGRSLVGQDYEQGLALERARDKAFSEQHPILDTGLNVAGGIGGTMLAAPAVAGPAAGAAIGRTLLGLGARTLPGAVGRGATAGLVQGAFAGAGEAEGGAADRGMGAITGGVIGGALGGALPLAIGAGRSALTPLYERATGGGDALSRLSAPARRYVAGISSPEAIDRIEQGLAPLGPQGMLADVSPEWNAVARGAASRPGGRDEVVRPLLDRTANSNARLQTDLNANLGPAVVPSQIESQISENLRTVGSQYEPAMAQASAVQTEPLAQRLEAMIVDRRGPAQDALRSVRSMLNIPGTNELDPHPGAVHEVRQAVDGLMAAETNPKVRGALGDARAELDNMLSRSVPGMKEIDEQYARLAAQREALVRGQTLLNTDRASVVRPAELADTLHAAVQPGQRFAGPSAEAFRMRQGLRADIDRVVGTAGNDARAIQRSMRGSEEAGDWNPVKMGQIFGQGPASRALGAVDREVTFQNTANRVAGGSDTAQTQQFGRALDAVESPIVGTAGATDATMAGLALNTLKRIQTVMTGAIGQARASRFASELGSMAVSQGATRDEFIAAMRQAGLNRAQISRTLDMATRGGLIVSRETSTQLTGRRE